MKAKSLLTITLLLSAPTTYLLGQVTCDPSNTKLVCEFPFNAQDLGIFAAGVGASGVGEKALATAAQTAATPINASIATQLTQLPVPSAAVGTVYIHLKEGETPKSFGNLGPILTDRPDTVGKNNLFVGFSFQHFNFTSLDGQPLANIPIGFSYSPDPTNLPNEVSYISVTNQATFHVNQYVASATYGLWNKTDVSLVVPVNAVSLQVDSQNFLGYEYDQSTQTYGQIFSPQIVTSSNGSASGVGDIDLGIKQLLIGGEVGRPAVAAGVLVRLPTGDALNYLGSGAIGANVYGLFEYRRRFAPHLKLAYQWNGASQLMNLAAPAPKAKLPGGLQYAAGADFKVYGWLNLAGDLLGAQFVNAPSLSVTPPLNLGPTKQSGVPKSIPAENSFNNTYTTLNLSGGAKVYLGNTGFLAYANALKQANNVGLRSRVVPLFGIAYKKSF